MIIHYFQTSSIYLLEYFNVKYMVYFNVIFVRRTSKLKNGFGPLPRDLIKSQVDS